MKKVLIALPLVVIVALLGLYFYANQETESQIDLYIERAIASGTYKDIQYESADFAVDASILIKGISVTDAMDFQYTIDELKISEMDFFNEFPHSINLSAHGFSLPMGLPDLDTSMISPDMQSFLAAIDGSESVPATLDYSHQYEPDNNNLFSSVMSFGLPEAFKFSINTTTRNISYETLNQISDPMSDPIAAQDEMMAALMNAEIPELSLRLSDFGLMETLLENQANQQGKSVDVLRQELMSMTQSLFLFAPADLQALAIDLSAELTSFMEGNKTFNFALHPDFSGNIQQLQAPIMGAFFTGDYGQIVDLLNIEFNTE
ncbi:MAG: hypothetical protein COA71_03615 [SAR86 cluster bacterium]|uniref:DUF945 family protein n=1 Tax=SAR86 cluster bacterium TaxID=2030880 RepID=A0A2A5CFG2_9GAMM|nr:hypothetical protein [Gammaproteobacteria bacterium AH-315-E17]PCJ42609.1 MAG: hypothetical protein COA71_03615 [SAR86 cluster bacterium]